MPTLNQFPLNVALINGPALASLPDTEDISIQATAEYEMEIPGVPPAVWELSLIGPSVAVWEIPFTAEIQES
jgi:hypothetical protein